MSQTPERLADVLRITEQAAARDGAERAAYLDTACGADASLRREVEAVLAEQAGCEGFLDTPPWQPRPAKLVAGQRLGPYEIQAAIGAGGMGEVYKARDTRLDRTIAIKVLPPEVSTKPERRARFEREAKAIAALSHPNICALFDIGHEIPTEGQAEGGGRKAEAREPIDFLVMEHLEGQTLAARLEKGKLPLEQALAIGAQIADALAAAHRQGIIHRDLKPANVMLVKAPAGGRGAVEAKLLDFGLAKLTGHGEHDVASQLASTPTASLTAKGTIVGTLQYMAPEQIEGKPVDARADIWALGAILYEMVTGSRAFEAPSAASLVAAILEHEPVPVVSLQPLAPPALDHLVRHCLSKSPDDRPDTAHDVAHELQWVRDMGSLDATAGGPPAPRRGKRTLALVAGALAMAAAGAVVALLLPTQRTPREQPETRLDLVTARADDPLSFAISPDGRKVVFQARAEAGAQLWLRYLDRETSQPLPGTSGATGPFWSPDNQSIAFYAEGRLKRVDVAGAFVRTLATVSGGSSRRGAWSRDGTILFGAIVGPLYAIPAGGGTPRPATVLLPGQINHRFPVFLPDGQRFLMLALGTPDVRGVYLGTLGTTGVRQVINTEVAFAFVPPDRLLMAQQGVLYARRLNLTDATPEGEAVPVAQQVLESRSVSGYVAVSGSGAGTLAYRASAGQQQLTWLDREGRVRATVGQPDDAQPEVRDLSSDARTAAADRWVKGNLDVWLIDVERGIDRRVTFDAAWDGGGTLSPDGRRVVYAASQRADVWDIYEATPGGGKPLLEGGYPFDWSPDGRYILYEGFYAPPSGHDLWVLPLTGDRTPLPVARTPFDETAGRFAPDGRWVAYQSDETGRPEIYVQPFQRDGLKAQVSVGGGTTPRWRGDGRELFYRAPDDRLMGVGIVQSGSELKAAPPRALFKLPPSVTFEPSPDGQRFLLPVPLSEVSPITVILNWRPPAR